MMNNLFTNVGRKLKAFAKAYFTITMWLLIVGGVIAFFALVSEEYTAPFAFGVLIGVPLAILGNLVFCWILHAFGSIAEKHEAALPEPEPENSPQPWVENIADDAMSDEGQNKMFRIAMVVFAVAIILIIILITL